MVQTDERVATQRQGLVLATVCLCQLMVVLDISVVNVALPSIGRDLGFSAAALSWVVNAYTLVFGGLLLLGGRVADLVGHRRAMLAGLGLFGVASVLGGLADGPGQLIAARAGQGLAGAVLAPISLTVIMVSFAEGAARNRAVAIWAMVASSGIAVGVLAGGVLTELLNWRWVLFVNVPIVAVALAMAVRSVHDSRQTRVGRLDVAGAVLGTAALTLLVYGMVEAGEHGWTEMSTVASLGLAVLCGAAFVVWEGRFAAQPLVRLGIFRTRTVWVADVIVVFIGAATIAGFYFASLYLQDVLHYGPLKAGAAFLPFCAGIMVASFASTRLAARLGNRVLLTGGLLVGAAGMFWFSLLDTDSTFLSGFLGPSLVASLGLGSCLVANIAMGTSGVSAHEAGLVSGLLNASRQCGGSVGLAVLSTVAVAATRHADTPDPVAALATGYARAFTVTGILVLAAAVCAAAFVPTARSASL